MIEERVGEILRQVDSWVTERPELRGLGYHNSQKEGRYDPAMEQTRGVLVEFFRELLARGLEGRFLQIGLGRHGGMHFALGLLAEEMLTVEKDPKRVAAYVAGQTLDSSREYLLQGDSGVPETIARVREIMPEVDVLFLDGEESFMQMRKDWLNYAPLVRAGGVIAFGDGSQAFPSLRERDDVDSFLFQMEKDYLFPRGKKLKVCNADRAILFYEQSEQMKEEWAGPDSVCLPLPEGFEESKVARCIQKDLGGFALFSWKGGVYGIPKECLSEGEALFYPKEIPKDSYEIVLQADCLENMESLIQEFEELEAQLAQCRKLLREGLLDEALEKGSALVRGKQGFRERLFPSLAAYPNSDRLLLVLGTFALFADAPREGWHLLHKVLQKDYCNQDLLQTLGVVALQILRDDALAQRLLGEVRTSLRKTELARICGEELEGSLLWSYPEFLLGIHGVLQVGAGKGKEVEAFSRLGLQPQVYLEPEPRAREELIRACSNRNPEALDRRILDLAAGRSPGEARLHLGAKACVHSLSLLQDSFQDLFGGQNTPSQKVSVISLDSMLQDGSLPMDQLNLLWLDAGGSELEVLRGAESYLKHVDLVRVKVFFAPVFDGVPEPEELRIFMGDQGFWLRAYEPDPHGLWGEAIFRRIRQRRR